MLCACRPVGSRRRFEGRPPVALNAADCGSHVGDLLSGERAGRSDSHDTVRVAYSLEYGLDEMEMHKDGIVVAEYWTVLPPKAELEAKLAEIVRDAQERLARRGIST